MAHEHLGSKENPQDFGNENSFRWLTFLRNGTLEVAISGPRVVVCKNLKVRDVRAMVVSGGPFLQAGRVGDAVGVAFLYAARSDVYASRGASLRSQCQD